MSERATPPGARFSTGKASATSAPDGRDSPAALQLAPQWLPAPISVYYPYSVGGQGSTPLAGDQAPVSNDRSARGECPWRRSAATTWVHSTSRCGSTATVLRSYSCTA